MDLVELVNEKLTEGAHAVGRKTKDDSIRVFIVIIGTYHGQETMCGAAFWNEEAARREIKRLNDANRYTRAYYVSRELPWPSAFIAAD